MFLTIGNYGGLCHNGCPISRASFAREVGVCSKPHKVWGKSLAQLRTPMRATLRPYISATDAGRQKAPKSSVFNILRKSLNSHRGTRVGSCNCNEPADDLVTKCWRSDVFSGILDRSRNCCIPRFVIMMAPLLAPEDLYNSSCSAHAAGDCIGPPACKKRRPSG